jgi:hypothetical protein
MSGVPIYPPGTNQPGARSPDDIQQKIIKNNQKNEKNNEKNDEKNGKNNTEKNEKNGKNEQEQKNKDKQFIKKTPVTLESSPPYKEQISHPQPSQQRMRKLPISINTSTSMLQPQPVSGKRKLIETPVTPTILSRLSGALSGVQNNLISKFTKSRLTINCEHCTNTGCISITSMRHDSDEDEDDEIDKEPPLEFQCTICRRTQSLQYMNQILGVTAKKLKIVSPSPTPSTSTPLPGTPASMVSPQDIAYSEQYMLLKTQINCMECAVVGSLVKFGFTKATPPRPRFKCNKCSTLFTINHVIQMMSNLNDVPPQLHLISPVLPEVEDIHIDDAQPRSTTPELESQDSQPILLDDNTPPPSTANPDVIKFLLDSVKQLTTQAAANQEKFDYITTLIEQNEQLQKELKEQKKENEIQKKEIEQLKKLLKEQKNNFQNNTTTKNNEKTTQKNTEQNSDKHTENNNNNNNIIQNTDIDTNMNTNSTDSLFPPLAAPIYVQQARKATKITYAPGQFRSHKPTTENLELASKIFNATQQQPTAEYKYLYFPSNKRMKPSVIRSKLTLLGVDNVRILDAHCPDWNAIALLIHANYEKELLAKFSQAQVHPITYDPLDPVHLRDQRCLSLTYEEKVTKLQNIFKNNLMRSLSFMRYPTCHSVAKFFSRKDILTSEELQSFLNNSKQKQIANAFPPTVVEQTVQVFCKRAHFV